jgi:hypothetical protein
VALPAVVRTRLPAHVRSPVLGALERALLDAARRLDAVDPPPEPFEDDALRPVLRVLTRPDPDPRPPR